MAFFGLFPSSRALRVTADAAVIQVPERLRVHTSQQFSRTWDISTGTNAAQSHSLTKLTLETPGLTVVRVRPQLLATQPDAVARIVATSDAAHHLERLEVAIKHKTELRMEFKNAKTTTAVLPVGTLVIEIELAHASLIDEIKAAIGGDVVVVEEDADVPLLARRDNTSVSLSALDHSRLFYFNTAAPLAVDSLTLASVSGGSVVVTSSHRLEVRKHLLCPVLGDGRVAVHAPYIESKELTIPVVGAQGHAQIVASLVVTRKTEAAVWGSGSILVQSAPLHESDAQRNACPHLKIEVSGAGCVDAAAIACLEADVTLRQGGRAVVEARERLTMTCEAGASSVECIGALPSRVDPAPAHIPAGMLLVTPYENRVWTASEPVPVAPSVVEMFATPRVLQTKKAGFRETVRPLWTAMQAATSPVSNGSGSSASAPATPSWVNVMSDAAGGKSVH